MKTRSSTHVKRSADQDPVASPRTRSNGRGSQSENAPAALKRRMAYVEVPDAKRVRASFMLSSESPTACAPKPLSVQRAMSTNMSNVCLHENDALTETVAKLQEQLHRKTLETAQAVKGRKSADRKVQEARQERDAYKKLATASERMLRQMEVEKVQKELGDWRKVGEVLEEHFTCSLCMEIMAAPYSLAPANCGHSFCGHCILRWFFSRLHVCGAWHEQVACPICRSLMAHIPEATPRSLFFFPFIRNRLADDILRELILKLASPPQTAILYNSYRAGHKRRQKAEAAPTSRLASLVEVTDADLKLLLWCDGPRGTAGEDIFWSDGPRGTAREDWLRRDAEGQEAMKRLREGWASCTAVGFLQTKSELGLTP